MSIGKNTLHYTLALVIQKVLGFVFFALIARVLGVEDTGLYVFALSFTTIFSVFADLGFAPVLIREIAKDKRRTQALFSQVFSAKIVMSLVTYGLVVLFVNLLGYPQLTKTLVYISGAVMVLDSFSLIFWAVFRGHQNLRYESMGIIGFQVVTVGLGLTVLFLGLGVQAVITATLVGSTFYFFFSLYWLLKKLKLKLRIVYHKQNIRWLLKLSFAFALAGVFARIYTQIDMVMISKLACQGLAQSVCDQQVGWYGIASKIVLALQFIPLAFSAALFPALSEQSVSHPAKLRDTYSTAWRYLAMVALPTAAGLIALAPQLVQSIWGDVFAPSVLPLQILMGSLVFLFLTFPNGALLNATGNQLRNTGYMGVVVVVNVVLNSFLIIQYQSVGAAIASIASTFTLFVLGFTYTHKLVKFDVVKLLANLFQLALAAIAMYVVLVALRDTVPWVVLVFVGAIVYSLVGFATQGIRRGDIRELKQLIRQS